MRRTKTMLMGDLLEEFFKRPYVAAKVAEGKLPDTWREIVGDRAAEITTDVNRLYGKTKTTTPAVAIIGCP